MSVLAIIAALLLEQWRPLADSKAVLAVSTRYVGWLEERFNAGEARHGTIAWTVGVFPIVLGSLLLYALLYRVHPLVALALNVAALYLTLGFRQFSHFFTGIQNALKTGELERARDLIGAWRGEAAEHRAREEVVRLAIEEALLASHRNVFAVLFWFVLLPGPSGALLYRLSVFLARRWGGLGAFGAFATRVNYWMEWPAVRLTAAAFAVVGDFEDAVYCWRTQAASWREPLAGIVLAAGAGAMGVRLGMPLAETAGGVEPRPELGLGEPADAPFLESTVGLLWRALVLWVFVLIMLGIARALG
ncbi:MAG: CobD/CbiB family protein [Betaproteobacteria bacterium]|nr:CobD/CbiB family protein [Betaproteobacteria bacterium]